MNVRALIVGGGLIGLLAAGLGGIWAYHAHGKTKARDDLELATTRLSDCVLGGPADGDVDQKVHRVQISARAAYAPDTTSAAWPKRCASYTQAIATAHRAAYARGVVKVIPSFDIAHDELGEGILTATASLLHGLAEFTHGPHDASVPAAPAELTPLLTKATIKPIGGDAKFGQISQLLVRSQEGLRFGMVDATLNGKRSCEYAHSAHAIRCVSTILNADLFAGDIGSDFAYSLVSSGTTASVFGVGSEPLAVINDVQFISHGRTFRDGHLELQVTMANDGTFVPQLFERDRVGHIKRTPFEITSSFGSGERLAGDFIVWKERPSSTPGEFESPSLTPATEKPATIKARELAAGSHAITVGTVGRRTYGEERTDGTCEADHLFFDMSPVLAIRDDKGGWHTLKPDALAADSFAARTMSCRGDVVTMVDRNEHAVHVQRCSVASGCSTQSVTVDLPKDAMVATVGADTLVIWADEDADAIYFVRSPLADLSKAKPKVLIDSALVITKAAPGGLGLTSMSSEAFPFGDEAVVFLGDTITYALSIKPDGTASSISAAP